jgi:hypothetical protein
MLSSKYLAEERKHVAEFILLLLLRDFCAWVVELCEQLAEMHQPQGCVRVSALTLTFGWLAAAKHLLHEAHGDTFLEKRAYFSNCMAQPVSMN